MKKIVVSLFVVSLLYFVVSAVHAASRWVKLGQVQVDGRHNSDEIKATDYYSFLKLHDNHPVDFDRIVAEYDSGEETLAQHNIIGGSKQWRLDGSWKLKGVKLWYSKANQWQTEVMLWGQRSRDDK
jgi:hypothetical protein